MTAQNKAAHNEGQKFIRLSAYKSPEVERRYGNYHVRLCFAEQDVPNAEKDLLGMIMQVYRQRVEGRCK